MPARTRLLLNEFETRIVPALTWDVQSDYFGTRDGVSQTRILRGLALSDDGTSLYGGFIQGSSPSSAIRMVSSSILAIPGNDTVIIGNEPAPFGSNPSYTTGLDARVTTPGQAKGLATDDRGYVYSTLNPFGASTTLTVRIYNSDLSSTIGDVNSTAASSQLGGVAVEKLDGKYYLYIGRNGGLATIERWDVTNPAIPTLDTSWGVAGRADLKTPFGMNAFVNGLEVDSDGTVYAAGGVLSTGRGDSLFKIPANGDVTQATRTDVAGAMDVAIFQDRVYVSQYLAQNSTIAEINKNDLSLISTVSTGFTHTNTDSDSGYGGIDVSFDGRLYVADQWYNFVPSSGSYTPPATSFNPTPTAITGTRIYFDRVYVSSPLITPTTVYVDDDWTALANGTPVMIGSTSATIGFDAFSTITAGVNAVLDNGTVVVLPGSYSESVDLTSKSLTLNPSGNDGTGPALVNISGGLTLDTNDNLAVDLNGATTPGTDYDQLVVGGPVDLGGANLLATLGNGYTPAGGDTLTLIDNSAITNQFAQGNQLTIGANTFDITYSDGDVILSIPAPPPVPPVPPPPVPPAPPPARFAAGEGGGSSSVVVYDGASRTEMARVQPFESTFTGGSRVSVGDVNGDTIADTIIAAGPGGNRFVILDGATGATLASIQPFEDGYFGGLNIASGDITGDGKAEVVVTADQGGGARVTVYDGAALAIGKETILANFFGLADVAGRADSTFRGGARVALGDVTGDNVLDLIVGAGFLGGPRVTVWSGVDILAAEGGAPTGTPVANFFAFEPTLRNGVFVAAGDVNGDNVADIILGAGPGGAPRIRIADGAGVAALGTDFSLDNPGREALTIVNFYTGDSETRGGIRVASRDLDNDGDDDLITGSGEGLRSSLQIYDGSELAANPTNPTASDTLDPFGSILLDGVFVG